MSRPERSRSVQMVISGRVQGVGFRAFTRQAAQRLGLVGWVRNLPSGEVELQARGRGSELQALRARLRQGPPGSRVDGLVETELEAASDWDGFRIVY